jgi:hypothetical protein
MRHPSLAKRLTLALALAVMPGCAAAFDGHTYHGEGFTFQVPPAPPEWRRVEATGAALAFEETGSQAQILVNARCDRDGEDVPLSSLTAHLFIRFTERKVESEDVLPFDGREALRTDITAKLDGVQKRFLVWVLKKDRCVYDLLYFAAPDRFERGGAAFDAWARGFRALPREVNP